MLNKDKMIILLHCTSYWKTPFNLIILFEINIDRH